MLGKTGAVRANVQTLIALFTHWFFMSQTILSKLRKWEKYGINLGIDRQIRAGITSKMLPPLGPNLTPFRPANPVVFNLYIAGFPGRISVPHKKKKIKIFLKNE